MSISTDDLRNGTYTPLAPTAPYVDPEVMYSGTTNGSGIYAVAYPVAYTVKPKVLFSVEGGTNKDTSILTSTTSGFSILVERRTDVLGLLPSYAAVNGLTVNVSVYG